MKKQLLGFTLVEVLLSITIISILAAVSYPMFQNYRDNAKKNADRSELSMLSGVFELYLRNEGHLPPIDNSDVCTLCHYAGYGTNTDHQWVNLIDELVASGYLKEPIYKDSWGNYYTYDNNYNHPCDDGCYSVLCSVGKDGVFTSHNNFHDYSLGSYLKHVTEVKNDDVCVTVSGKDS